VLLRGLVNRIVSRRIRAFWRYCRTCA